jgi:hypothetical protein
LVYKHYLNIIFNFLAMKKMKNIISVALLAMLTGVACKKADFLSTVPYSNIAAVQFFNNESDLQLYCNQYYSTLPIQTLVKADDNSDDKAPAAINSLLANTYTIPSAAIATDIDGSGSFSSSGSGGTINGTGTNWNWAAIRAMNFFLANYNKATASTSIKNIYVGETLFFRANEYFKKVKVFGDVPYVNQYITDTSAVYLYMARTPHLQVMDSVLKDINFAVANLPVAPADGRIGKYQALALKARICLWEGTWRKYNGQTGDAAYLQAAVDAAEQLMTSGKFTIYTTGNTQTDYYNLFIQDELKTNPETILAMRYLAGVLMNNIDRSLGQASDGYSKDFVRSFLCTDGLPTALSPLYKGDDTPDNEVTNRDPRYKQQIATRGFDFLNGDLITLPRIGSNLTSTGYQPIKGRSNSVAANNSNQSTYDLFIFRYAETLLIEAEAKAELGTCTQATLDATINKLRDRVGMPHMIIASLVKDPNSIFPALPVLLDEIRRERRVELGSDGFRLDDLKRWHAGTLINNPATILGMKLTPTLRAQYPASQVASIQVDANNYIRVYPAIAARTWADKLYLYPIPTQELTLNPNLKQNTGWN